MAESSADIGAEAQTCNPLLQTGMKDMKEEAGRIASRGTLVRAKPGSYLR